MARDSRVKLHLFEAPEDFNVTSKMFNKLYDSLNLSSLSAYLSDEPARKHFPLLNTVYTGNKASNKSPVYCTLTISASDTAMNEPCDFNSFICKKLSADLCIKMYLEWLYFVDISKRMTCSTAQNMFTRGRWSATNITIHHLQW